MSRSSDGETLYPERILIAPGASLRVAPMAGQISILLKQDYALGGSLCVTNTSDSMGSSNAIGLSGYAAQQYLLGIGEILSFDSTGSFYLSAFGQTASCYILRVRTAGTGN